MDDPFWLGCFALEEPWPKGSAKLEVLGGKFQKKWGLFWGEVCNQLIYNKNFDLFFISWMRWLKRKAKGSFEKAGVDREKWLIRSKSGS
jgi:hypothetical protein